MKLPRISVVIPCYNAAGYIGAVLGSVLSQQWPDREVIVVEYGSSDASVRLIQESFPGIILVEQRNSSVAVARNAGLARATGEWIAFVDADDFWLPRKLHAQWSLVAAHSKARLTYGAWVVWRSAEPRPDAAFLADIEATANIPSHWTGPSGWIYPQMLLDCEVWTSTVLAKRSLFDEIGVFDVGLCIGEDYDLWLRASRVTEILRLDRPMALYRMHGLNITRSAPVENHQAKVIASAISRWGYDSPDGARASPSLVRKALARSWRGFANSHLDAGDRLQARRGALAAVRLDPAHLDLGGWRTLGRAKLAGKARTVSRRD